MRTWQATDDDLRATYLRPRTSHPDRPWVLANMVAGIDGCSAVDGRVGELSGPADKLLFQQLRQVADVVLVGAETIRAERYGPVRLTDHEVATRTARGQHPLPRTAVVSRSLEFDWTIPLFGSGGDGHPRPLILAPEAIDPGALAAAERYAEIIVAGHDTVDLADALHKLHDLGAGTVLAEGGARTLGALAAAGLLDELCLTLAPMMGGDPLPIAVWPRGAPTSAFHLASVGSEDGDLFLRYLREPQP